MANADFSGISGVARHTWKGRQPAGSGVSGAVLRLTLFSDPTFAANQYRWLGRVRLRRPSAGERLHPRRAKGGLRNLSREHVLEPAGRGCDGFAVHGREFRLTGRVTTRAGEPLTSLQIRLLAFPSGQVLATAFTGTDGSYDLRTHRDGSEFTIRPQAAAFTFLPLSHRVENLNANRTLNFEAQRDHFVARANVRTSFGLKLPRRLFALLGAPTNQEVTYGVGSIQAVLPGGRTYTLIPLREGVTFSPPSITFGDLVADRVLEFTATPVLPLEGESPLFWVQQRPS